MDIENSHINMSRIDWIGATRLGSGLRCNIQLASRHVSVNDGNNYKKSIADGIQPSIETRLHCEEMSQLNNLTKHTNHHSDQI